MSENSCATLQNFHSKLSRLFRQAAIPDHFKCRIFDANRAARIFHPVRELLHPTIPQILSPKMLKTAPPFAQVSTFETGKYGITELLELRSRIRYSQCNPTLTTC